MFYEKQQYFLDHLLQEHYELTTPKGEVRRFQSSKNLQSRKKSTVSLCKFQLGMQTAVIFGGSSLLSASFQTWQRSESVCRTG